MPDKKIENIFRIFLIFPLALVVPLILIPIEKLLPYPYVIEELAKLGLTLLIIQLSQKRLQLGLALASGILFAISESIFYLGSAFTGGYPGLFIKKLSLTSLFHTSTFLLFLVFAWKSKKLFPFSFVLACLWHFFFNQIF
jgi:hypothetical protein